MYFERKLNALEPTEVEKKESTYTNSHEKETNT